MTWLVSWVGVSPAGAGLENPCGVLGEDGTAAVGDLHVIVADLRTRAYGLTLLSQEIIVYVSSPSTHGHRYCDSRSLW